MECKWKQRLLNIYYHTHDITNNSRIAFQRRSLGFMVISVHHVTTLWFVPYCRDDCHSYERRRSEEEWPWNLEPWVDMDSFPSSLWSSVQESILYFQGGRDVGRDDEGSPSQLTGLHFDISNPLLIAFDHHPSFQSVHSQSWIRDIKVETEIANLHCNRSFICYSSLTLFIPLTHNLYRLQWRSPV